MIQTETRPTRPLSVTTQEREIWRRQWVEWQAVGNPIVVAYGGGVDSTAVILGLHELGIRPDKILTADTGDEQPATYDFVNGPMQDWLASVGFPPVEWVRYVPSDYKYWPDYTKLSENCLTNSTLPSLAFGFKSCSQKWKVGPQDKHVASWQPAIDAWAAGKKVIKLIGYDAGPKDIRRRNHAGDRNDTRYHYEYPLITWGWDRETCKAYIASRGLPVPCKSACYMCPATHPEELHEFHPDLLRKIVIIEARAFPRLMGNWNEVTMLEFNRARWEKWELKGKKTPNVFRPSFDLWMASLDAKISKKTPMQRGEWPLIPAPGHEEAATQSGWKPDYPKPMTTKGGVTGLWRSDTKKRSGRITDYIRDKGLLPDGEVDRLIREVPTKVLTAADIESWDAFLKGFLEPAAESACGICSCVGV